MLLAMLAVGALAGWANMVGQGHTRDLSDVGKGTGQGLAIASAIVDRHGGTLTLEDGRPTTFVIRLPLG
jgi:signal transduction histidine kinase